MSYEGMKHKKKAGVLELPPIGWQLFVLGISQSNSTAFQWLLDTYTTRLLAEPLSSAATTRARSTDARTAHGRLSTLSGPLKGASGVRCQARPERKSRASSRKLWRTETAVSSTTPGSSRSAST